MTDTAEGLLREAIDRFRPNRHQYHFEECPFCGCWLSHGEKHHAGHAMTMSGPLVCWITRAERILTPAKSSDVSNAKTEKGK